MNHSRFVAVLVAVAVALLGSGATVEGQAAPDVQVRAMSAWPHLVITGATGTVHVIESRESMDGNSVWRTLAFSAMGSNRWEWDDQTLFGSSERYYRVLALTNTPPPNPNPGRLVWIPPGTFTMGSPANERNRNLIGDNREGPQTVVTLTKDFFMDKYLVTQTDYLSLMHTNPSYISTNIGYPEDLSRPVDQVSWYDATNYCWVLTQSEQAAGRLPAGWTYRLPTEAEWEYACRAGTVTPFSCGNDLRSGMADFDGRHEYVGGVGDVYNPAGIAPFITPVGTYPPNPWGLYDMIGNTGTWCIDPWWYYPGGTVTDIVGTPTLGYSWDDTRSARGGVYGRPGWMCRSAFRNNLPASDANVARGIRVLLARDEL